MAGFLTRARHERPRLYAAAQTGLVVVALVLLLNFVAPDIVSAIPLPDLPDLPDLPGWARWVRIAVVVGIVALVVIGEVEKDRDREEPDD